MLNGILQPTHLPSPSPARGYVMATSQLGVMEHGYRGEIVIAIVGSMPGSRR
jgi:hypothetical protein